MAGILDTITLAGTLILAIPAALAGLEFALVRGEPVVGTALLVLAGALVAGKQYLTLPTDVPALLAKRVVGAVVGDPDSSESESDEE